MKNRLIFSLFCICLGVAACGKEGDPSQGGSNSGSSSSSGSSSLSYTSSGSTSSGSTSSGSTSSGSTSSGSTGSDNTSSSSPTLGSSNSSNATSATVVGPCSLSGNIRSFTINCTRTIQNFTVGFSTASQSIVMSSVINGVRYDTNIQNNGTSLVGYERAANTLGITINFADSSTASVTLRASN